MKSRPILFSAPMIRALLAGTKTQTRRVVKPQPAHGCHFAINGAMSGACHLHTESFAAGQFDRCYVPPKATSESHVLPCPYGQPGDRLVVRETWQYYDWSEDGEPCIRFQADNATSWPSTPEQWADRLTDIWEILSREANYSIDNRARDRRWRPSIHMPRWASRLTLEITGVRVERLQDISEADAVAEGITSDTVIVGASCYGGVHHEHQAIRHFFDGCDDDGFEGAYEAYAALWESINGPGSWDANPWVWVLEFRRVDP